jgi:hypothetical protein
MLLTFTVPESVRKVAEEALQLHRKNPGLENVKGITVAEALSGGSVPFDVVARMRRFFIVTERGYNESLQLLRTELDAPVIRSWLLHGAEVGKAWAEAAYQDGVKQGLIETDPIVELLKLTPEEIYARFSANAWRFEYDLTPEKAVRFIEEYQLATGLTLDLPQAFGNASRAIGNAIYRKYHTPNPYQQAYRAMMVEDTDYQLGAELDLIQLAMSITKADALDESLSPADVMATSASKLSDLVWPTFLAYFVLAVEDPEKLKALNDTSAKPPQADQPIKPLTAYNDALKAYATWFHPKGKRYVDPTESGEEFSGLTASLEDLVWRSYLGKKITRQQAIPVLMQARAFLAAQKKTTTTFNTLLAAWKKGDWQSIIDALPEDADVKPLMKNLAAAGAQPTDGAEFQNTPATKEAKAEVKKAVDQVAKDNEWKIIPFNTTATYAAFVQAGTPVGVHALVKSHTGTTAQIMGAVEVDPNGVKFIVMKNMSNGVTQAYEDGFIAGKVNDGGLVAEKPHKDIQTDYSKTKTPTLKKNVEKKSEVADHMQEVYAENAGLFTPAPLSETMTGTAIEEELGVKPVEGMKLKHVQKGWVFTILQAFSSPNGYLIVYKTEDDEIGDHDDDEIAQRIQAGMLVLPDGEKEKLTTLVTADKVSGAVKYLVDEEGFDPSTTKEFPLEKTKFAKVVTAEGGNAGPGTWWQYGNKKLMLRGAYVDGDNMPYLVWKKLPSGHFAEFDDVAKNAFNLNELYAIPDPKIAFQDDAVAVAPTDTSPGEATGPLFSEGSIVQTGEGHYFRVVKVLYDEKKYILETMSPVVETTPLKPFSRSWANVKADDWQQAAGVVSSDDAIAFSAWIEESLNKVGIWKVTPHPGGVNPGSLLTFGELTGVYLLTVGQAEYEPTHLIVRIRRSTEIGGDAVTYYTYEGWPISILAKAEKPAEAYEPPTEKPEPSAEDEGDTSVVNMAGTEEAFEFCKKKGWVPVTKEGSSVFKWDLGDVLHYGEPGTAYRTVIGYAMDSGTAYYIILTEKDNVNFKVAVNANKSYGPKATTDQATILKLKPPPGSDAKKFPKLNYKLSSDAKKWAAEKDEVFVPSDSKKPFLVGAWLERTVDNSKWRFIGWIDSLGGSKLNKKNAILLKTDSKGKTESLSAWSNVNAVFLAADYAQAWEHSTEIDKENFACTIGKNGPWPHIDAVGVHLVHGTPLPDDWDSPTPIKQPQFENLEKGQHVSAGIVVVLENYSFATGEESKQYGIAMTHPAGEYGGYALTFPKGTVEKGESLEKAAVREVWEETGLTVKPVAYLGDYKGKSSTTRFFIGYITGGYPSTAGKETDAVTIRPLDKVITKANKFVDDLTDRDKKIYLDAAEWVAKHGSPNSNPVDAADYDSAPTQASSIKTPSWLAQLMKDKFAGAFTDAKQVLAFEDGDKYPLPGQDFVHKPTEIQGKVVGYAAAKSVDDDEWVLWLVFVKKDALSPDVIEIAKKKEPGDDWTFGINTMSGDFAVFGDMDYVDTPKAGLTSGNQDVINSAAKMHKKPIEWISPSSIPGTPAYPAVGSVITFAFDEDDDADTKFQIDGYYKVATSSGEDEDMVPPGTVTYHMAAHLYPPSGAVEPMMRMLAYTSTTLNSTTVITPPGMLKIHGADTVDAMASGFAAMADAVAGMEPEDQPNVPATKDTTAIWNELLFSAKFPITKSALNMLKGLAGGMDPKPANVTLSSGVYHSKTSTDFKYGMYVGTGPSGSEKLWMFGGVATFVDALGKELGTWVILYSPESGVPDIEDLTDANLNLVVTTKNLDNGKSWLSSPVEVENQQMLSIFTHGLSWKKGTGMTVGAVKKVCKNAGLANYNVLTEDFVLECAAMFAINEKSKAEFETFKAMLASKMAASNAAKKAGPKGAAATVTGATATLAETPPVVAIPQSDIDSPSVRFAVDNPNPALFKSTGKKVSGGSKPNQLLAGPGNRQWFFKTGLSGETDFRAYTDRAAYELSDYIKGSSIPVGVMEFDGKVGSFQPYVSDAAPVPSNPEDLNDDQKMELLAQHMADMFFGDHDGHAGNWIKLGNGTIRAVDRGQAFKFMFQGKPDSYDPTYHPSGNIGSGYAKGLLVEWSKSQATIPQGAFSAMRKAIAKIEAMPDEWMISVVEPVIAAHKVTGTEAAKVVKELRKRRDNYLEDWTKVMKKLADKRGETFKWPEVGTVAKASPIFASSPKDLKFAVREEKAIADAAKSGWQGKALQIDRDAIEEQNVMVRPITLSTTKVKQPGTLIHFRIAQHVGASAVAKLNKVSKTMKVLDDRLKIDAQKDYFNIIQNAIKTVMYHTGFIGGQAEQQKGEKKDLKINLDTYNKAISIKPELQKLFADTADQKAIYKPTGESNSNVHAMAGLYVDYIDNIEWYFEKARTYLVDALKAAGQEIPPSMPYMQALAAFNGAKLSTDDFSISKATIFKPFTPKADEEPEEEKPLAYNVKYYPKAATWPEATGTPNGGEVSVQSFDKQMITGGYGQPQFIIEDPTSGARLYFTPPAGAGADAHNKGYHGQVWGVIPGDAAPGTVAHLFKLFQDATGIEMMPATKKDTEALYWAKQVYVLQGKGGSIKPGEHGVGVVDPAFKKAMAAYQSGDTEKAVEDFKKITAAKMGTTVAALEKSDTYAPEGQYTRGAGWHRHTRMGWTRESLKKLFKMGSSQIFPCHGLINNTAESFAKVALLNGAVISTNAKPYYGVPINGGSPSADVQRGGSQGVFGVFRKGFEAGSNVLYLDWSILLRTDLYVVGTGDSYGDVDTPRFTDPEVWREWCGSHSSALTDHIGCSSHYQINYRHEIDLREYLYVLTFKDQKSADAMKKLYAQAGWTTFAQGRTLDQVFVTAGEAKI